MAQILQKTLQVSSSPLFYQQTRNRGKINVRKPLPPHFKKALIEKFITPVYAKATLDLPLSEICEKRTDKREKELGPYEKIIAAEVAGLFRDSRLVAFLHRNSITYEGEFDFRVKLKKYNMTYKSYSSAIAREALRQSNFTDAFPLVQSRFGLVFGSEVHVPALQRILKSTPQFYLLAGILDHKLLYLHQFLKYGGMNDDQIYGELVSVLQTAGGANLTRQLTHHQNAFVQHLNAIQQRGNETTVKTEAQPEQK